jgi:hypothetical protein
VLGREQLFLNTSSDATLLEPALRAAEAFAAGDGPPTDEQLAADVELHGVTPLFDGRELERI